MKSHTVDQCTRRHPAVGGVRFSRTWSFLSKDVLSKFPDFFSRNFVYFHVFRMLFPNIGMRSVPNILPCVKFQSIGNVLCFSCFSCFCRGKKKENLDKICLIGTGREAFQIFCPMLMLEMFPTSPASVFLGQKKRGKIRKSCSIRKKNFLEKKEENVGGKKLLDKNWLILIEQLFPNFPIFFSKKNRRKSILIEQLFSNFLFFSKKNRRIRILSSNFIPKFSSFFF